MEDRLTDITLHDAIAVLEGDGCYVSKIFVEPPEGAPVETDEDSADEDSGGYINNLNDRHLNSRCEVVIPSGVANCLEPGNSSSNHHENGNLDSSTQRSHQEVPAPTSDCDGPGSKRPRKTWVKEDLTPRNRVFPEPDVTKFRGKTPVEVFEMFFDSELIEFIVDETRKYALFLNGADPKITCDEIRGSIAVLILSGYLNMPDSKFYWDEAEDTKNVLVTEAFEMDRFMAIMRCIHFADNHDPKINDPLWKMRPFIELLKCRFRRNFIPNEHLSYVESMISYYGRHECQYIYRYKRKSISFGFKNWCLNSSNGYLVDFEVCPVKSAENGPYESRFGNSAAPLAVMLDNLPADKKSLPLKFYFDDSVTSLELLRHLKTLGYDGTGTVRDSHIPESAGISDISDMKKMSRGTYEYAKCQEEDIMLVRWLDRSVLTAMSTCHGVQPLTETSRFSLTDRETVQIPYPDIFAEFKKFKNGVGVMDESIFPYRIGIRNKKWWWSIFTYLLDVAINNAWLCYKSSGDDMQMQMLEFRREIAKTYLLRCVSVAKSALGRPPSFRQCSTSGRVPDQIRYDGTNHLLTPARSRRRCANEGCKSQTRKECLKCGVGLCVACNIDFHVRK